MAEKIKLVQGDSLPFINLTLTKSDGTVADLSDANTTITILFRAAGSTTTLSTIHAQKVNGGGTGLARFSFDNGVLNVDPGSYEGEVVIDFGGGVTQTVYDLLKFHIRQR